MKALKYFEPGRVDVVEMSLPTIGLGDVLIEVCACGVCATDVKTFLRGHPKIRPGTVLGHEIAGVVAAADSVEGWHPGQRVAVAPYAPCGVCSQCAQGQFTLCEHLFDVQLEPGGFSEFLRVPPRIVSSGLRPLPEGTGFMEATFAEPLACCLHDMEMLNLHAGESLLILGDGPMGLLQAELGRLFGASPIILSGMTPERLVRAACTADVVIDARNEDVAESGTSRHRWRRGQNYRFGGRGRRGAGRTSAGTEGGRDQSIRRYAARCPTYSGCKSDPLQRNHAPRFFRLRTGALPLRTQSDRCAQGGSVESRNCDRATVLGEGSPGGCRPSSGHQDGCRVWRRRAYGVKQDATDPIHNVSHFFDSVESIGRR